MIPIFDPRGSLRAIGRCRPSALFLAIRKRTDGWETIPKLAADATARLRAWDHAPRPFVTPSLLNCDFNRVGEELDALKAAGAVAVHLDVMDGHFVPNLTYGAPVIRDWRKRTDFPFDAHLMIADPARYLDDFVEAGCDTIIFQIEAVPDPADLIRRIKAAGCRASLALNPPTPLSAIEPFLDAVDAVLVMSVMPGFGGQKFDPAVLDKVRALRAERPNLWISIDGGVKPDTATARRRGGGFADGRRLGRVPAGRQLRGGPGRVGRGDPAAVASEAVPRPPGRAAGTRMTQVVLIRPGATVYDEQNRVQGVLDVPLRDRGWAEVAELADKLAGVSGSAAPLLRPERERRPDRRGRRQDPGPPPAPGRRTAESRPGALARACRSTRSSAATSRSSASGSRTLARSARPTASRWSTRSDRIKSAIKPLIKRHRDEAIGLVACEPIAQLIACYLRRDPRVQLADHVPTGGFERITSAPSGGALRPASVRSERLARPFPCFLDRRSERLDAACRKPPKERLERWLVNAEAPRTAGTATSSPSGCPKGSSCGARGAAPPSSASR